MLTIALPNKGRLADRCLQLFERSGLRTQFFEAAGVHVELAPVTGAVEVPPHLGVADVIADLTATGSTLNTNGLREIETVMMSTARLIASPTASVEPGRDREVRHLVMALGSVIRAEHKRYLMARNGFLILTESPEEAMAFTDRFAPEHLLLMTVDAAAAARRVRTSGTVFVGPSTSVAFGDYMTGANHVLPTAGRARTYSGLSVEHYLRTFTIQRTSPSAAEELAEGVAVLAVAEGLPGHADAARARKMS